MYHVGPRVCVGGGCNAPSTRAYMHVYVCAYVRVKISTNQPPHSNINIDSDDKALDTRWFWAPAPMRTDGGEARPHSDNTGSGKEAVVAGLSGDQGDKAAAAAYDESHDQDRCTVLFKATTPTTTTNTNGKGEGDVLVAHTTFDYYVAAWQRVVKDVVLPVLPVNLPPPPPPPLPPSDPANENADRAAQQEQGGEGDKRRAGRGKEAPPQEQEQPPPVPVPVLPPRTRQLFSASAGQLASLDDFYVIRGEVSSQCVWLWSGWMGRWVGRHDDDGVSLSFDRFASKPYLHTHASHPPPPKKNRVRRGRRWRGSASLSPRPPP